MGQNKQNVIDKSYYYTMMRFIQGVQISIRFETYSRDTAIRVVWFSVPDNLSMRQTCIFQSSVYVDIATLPWRGGKKLFVLEYRICHIFRLLRITSKPLKYNVKRRTKQRHLIMTQAPKQNTSFLYFATNSV